MPLKVKQHVAKPSLKKPEPMEPFPDAPVSPKPKPAAKKDGGNSRAAVVDGHWLTSGTRHLNLFRVECVEVALCSGETFEVRYHLLSGKTVPGRVGTRDEAYAEADMAVAAIKEL